MYAPMLTFDPNDDPELDIAKCKYNSFRKVVCIESRYCLIFAIRAIARVTLGVVKSEDSRIPM